MLFCTKDYIVDLISDEDTEDILNVYNSNPHFLVKHMDKESVTKEWILSEYRDMKEKAFLSCKIIEKCTHKVIGIIDFKTGQETYLSLLMLLDDYKNNGIGKIVYQGLEEYVRSKSSKSLRIDVVVDYDKSIYDFWLRNGFKRYREVTLNCPGKSLSAVIMKKVI